MPIDQKDISRIQWDDGPIDAPGGQERQSIKQSDISRIQWDDDVSSTLNTYHRASLDKPEAIARADILSKKAGVPFEVAKTIPDEVEAELAQPDWRLYSQGAPKTAKYLAENPIAFQQIKGNEYAMADVEQYHSSIKKNDGVFSSIAKQAQTFDNQARKAFIGLGLGEFERHTKPAKHYDLTTVEPESRAAYMDKAAGLLEMIDAQQDQAQKERMLSTWGISGIPENRMDRRQYALALKIANAETQVAPETKERQKKIDVMLDMVRDENSEIAKQSPVNEKYSPAWIASGVTNMIGQMFPAMLAGVTFGPGGAATVFSGQSVGAEYADARAEGYGEDKAGEISIIKGGAEAAGEMVGGGAILDAVKATAFPVIKRIFGAAGINASEEVVTEIINQFYDSAALGRGVEIPEEIQKLDISDREKQFLASLDSQAQTGTIGAFGGGATTGAGIGASTLAKKYMDKKARSDDSAQQISAMSQAVAALKAASVNPDRIREHIASLDTDSPAVAHINAGHLFQQGVTAEQIQVAFPKLDPITIQQAYATNADIQVPLADYMADVAGTDIEGVISEHVRFDPDDWSAWEAMNVAPQMVEDMKQQTAKMLEGHQNRTALEESGQKVYDSLYKEAVNLGQPENQARMWAELYKGGMIASAVQANTTPEALMAEFFGGIENKALPEQESGQVLNQRSLMDLSTEIERSGIKLDAYENGAVITLSKIIVPNERRGAGEGTAAMQKLIDYADATGKQIALTPSSDFGGSKGRLEKFYAGLGFVKNKGKNKDFAVSESMVRKPVSGKVFQSKPVDVEGLPASENGNILESGSQESSYENATRRTTDLLQQWWSSTGVKPRGGDRVVERKWQESSTYRAELGRTNVFIKEEEFTPTPAEGRLEQENLYKAAKENGFFFDADNPLIELIQPYKIKGGMEHDAYVLGDEVGKKLVIRSTKRTPNGALFGHSSKNSPAEYLKRNEMYNQVFRDHPIHMIGVSQNEDGSLTVLTAQPYVHGKELESGKELDALLRRDGWYQMGAATQLNKDRPGRYQHKDTGVIINDVHTGNILVGPNGELYPIDVYVEKLPDAGKLFQNNQLENRGAFDINTRKISLFESQDLSTFLHETGHLFLEMQVALSTREGVSDKLKTDVGAIFKWFGVTQEDWSKMTLEEKRPYHEKFAESFEQYLFEGKAPSLELKQAFRTFRNWLTHVYKSLSRFISGHNGAKLNDEIRGVMDRMLATEEQIKAAEAARNMGPLFASKEDAGATDAEWAELTQQMVDATNTAEEQFAAKSMRDMALIRNVRSKALRKLRREAVQKRKAAREEAQMILNRQPIYMAYAFLRRTLEKDKPKGKEPDFVDPARDSILKAIAKSGGINKEAAVKEWGIDPKDKYNSGRFGQPVFRKEGGLSIDGMAKLLSQYGYLPLDENGKWDLNDLWDMISDEHFGNKRYAAGADWDVLAGIKIDQLPEYEWWGARLNLQVLADMYEDRGGQIAEDSVDDGQTLNQRKPVDGTKITGDELIQHLVDMKVTAKEGGVHPEAVAERYGFTSADEMLRKMVGIDPRNDIENLANRIMLERHGELADAKSIEKAADAAVHNEARLKAMATELQIMARAQKQTRLPVSVVKQFAADIIGQLKVRDIRPNQYAVSEAREARAAEKAMIAGKKADALMAKRNQMLHAYTAKAAYEALEEVDKSVAYMKKFEKAGIEKRLDPDYLIQIQALLERYDLRKQSLSSIDDKAALLEWVEQQKAMGFEPVIDERLLNEAKRKPYKELTMEELRGLVDSIKNIEHLGRLKHKLLTDKRNRELEATATALASSIADNSRGEIPEELEKNSLGDKAKDMARSFLSIHRKLASYARQIDGHKDAGEFWETIIEPMNAAGNAEAVLNEKTTMELSKIFADLKGKKLTQKMYIPSIGASLSHEARLAVALNWGNEGNRQRLLDGDKWTPMQVQAILGTLTESDLKFVQDVWDHIESRKAEIGAQQKRLTGIEPEWIEASPFVVNSADGVQVEMKGGYYPAKYDTDRSTKSMSDEQAGSLMDQWRGAKGRAKTRDSHTKARAKMVMNRPVRKDLGVLTQHLSEVNHRLAFQDWVVDMNRLLRKEQVDQALRANYGPNVVREILKTVEDIAIGDIPAQTVFEAGVNHLRVGTTIAGLGWNLMTSLLQPMGLTQSMVRIGPKWVARGMSTWLGSPEKMMARVDEIHAKSPFMRLRGKTMQREINEVLNTVRKEKRSKVEASFFYLIQKMQMVADVPTWLGAYEKAIAENHSEEKAIAMADQAVLDSQGGGQIKDVSRIQRGGPLQKIFTNFYSFFNTLHNLTAESVNRTDFKDPASTAKFAADMMLLYMLPAAMATLMKHALTGDDDDELAEKLVRDQMTYLLGTMVGVRELSAAVNGFNGYSGPTGTRFFSEFGRLGKQVEQGEADAAFLKSLNNSAGVLLHYPAGQVQRMAEGVTALAEGDTQNPLVLMTGYKQ